MSGFLRSLQRNEEGAGLAEWGLLVSLIAIAAIGAVQLFGGGVETLWQNISSGVNEGLNGED